MINHPNVAIARAEDILAEARNCVECIWLAAETLDEKTGPIQYVANIASKRIDEAVAMLGEYRNGDAVQEWHNARIAKSHQEAQCK
jgi:hypothetical protein